MQEGDPRWDQWRLALVPGIGPRLQQRLLEAFGSASDVFRASRDALCSVDGIGHRLAWKIRSAPLPEAVQREWERCRRYGIRVLFSDDDAYPPPLRLLEDPPTVLYQRGLWEERDALAVALVGTRRATAYGRRQAERLAAELSEAGVTIVSGLARGIDGAAHRAALRAGGRTLAVLGSGLQNIYPPQHRALADRVAEHGALFSEMLPLQAPRSGTFPQRNRLISGMSLGVVVVEAASRSGALITAGHAAEQGREVFAVPGPVDREESQGCHQLLRDGACLVASADDVLRELGPPGVPAPPIPHPVPANLNAQETTVLEAIGETSADIDDVIRRSGLPASRVLATLSVLETRRLVRREAGRTVRRT